MLRTLKGKISFIYICLVVLIAIVGITSVFNLLKLTKSIDGLMTNNYKSINAVANMVNSLENQNSSILTYINSGNIKEMDSFNENSNTFLKWLNIESNNITEPGEKEYVANLNNNYLSYMKLFSRLQEVRNSIGYKDAMGFYSNKVSSVFIKLKSTLKEISDLNEKAMFSKKKLATENAHNSTFILVILSIFAVIGGFLTSTFFTNRFLNPIFKITQTIKKIKADEIAKHGKFIEENQIFLDEVGELEYEFNKMTLRLNQFENSTLGQIMTEKNKSTAIIKSISDPLLVLDSDYRVIFINNSFESFFKVFEQNSLNKHFLELVSNGELFNHISGIKDEENSERILFLQSTEEGFYFNVIITIVKDAESKLSGYIVVFHDVTQLKELEKVKTDFIATISHEIKTPLTSIMMGSSLILDENIGKLNLKQKNIIEAIMEDGERLSKLVSDLLELSKLESKSSIFNFNPCSIKAIVECSIKPIKEMVNQKRINLNIKISEDLPMIKADFEKTTWVIGNLISNALKYTEEGGNIEISADLDAPMMRITVKDTGIGIPSEYKDKIFEKYVQVTGYDLEVRGTGLGLAIVKEIITGEAGEIWYESELGFGSKFVFTLPLFDEEIK